MTGRQVWGKPLGVPGDRDAEICMYSDQCDRPASAQFSLAICDRHAQFVYDRINTVLAVDELKRMSASRLRSRMRDSAVRRRAEEHVRGTLPVVGPSDGYVYYIRFGAMVKIGYSKNPLQRIRDLPHEEVLDIRPGTREHERAAHRVCAEWRVMGEWFEDCPEFRRSAGLDAPASAM